ncbi:hypothetical protein Btru_058858 [Bulinus truncatus]|nr:hypothetical protein Btru_058858 [Bulinus truncatus]
MGSTFLKWILFLYSAGTCTTLELFISEFHMDDVTGTANWTWDGITLNVSLKLSKTLGSTAVELHEIWMEYDVQEKCSDQQIGTALSGLTKNTTVTENTVVTLTYESNYSVEGYSVVLRSSNKTICATILKDTDYTTAAAHFMGGLVNGYVYFRQATSSPVQTRVVTDLFSSDSSSLRWKISDSSSGCSSITSSQAALQLQIYNPDSDGTGCISSSKQCAVGNLSGKFGDPALGKVKGEKRRGYSDNNLPLSGAKNIDNKLLIMYTTDGTSFVCAKITILKKRSAVVKFSHDGVRGSLTFSQKSPMEQTVVQVDLQGLNNNAKGYHVHAWPTPTKIVYGQNMCGNPIVSGHFNPYSKNPSSTMYPQPDMSTDDMYEIGDLSAKYGTLANLTSLNATYKDWNLPLFGVNSVIGRSLVIHKNDATASRWICSNIRPQYSVVLARAVFKNPVIGQIMFMQEMGEPDSETSVFVQLDYNDGRGATQGHMWRINSYPVVYNNLLSPENCQSTGPILDPFGNLSQRLNINIRNIGDNDTSSKLFLTDLTLPISGIQSIINKSLVIMNLDNTTFLSCANIKLVKDTTLYAQISNNEIKGSINFTQTAGFDSQETILNNNILGLSSGYSIKIYELPPSETNDCTGLGAVYNPLNITDNSVPTTDDTYKVGDISRFSTLQKATCLNLPLSGLTSISGRSLVLLSPSNVVIACAKIDTFLYSELDQQITAISKFTGDVIGNIYMYQTLFADGSMSDTSVLVDLKNSMGSLSFQHNWHTHVNPVNGDDQAVSGRCDSTGPHFDPFKTMVNMTNYGIECSKLNPLRCELGDQAMKLGTYDLSSGKKLFTDVDLPLIGAYTVQGRSIVVHVKDKGAPRLTCADIIPISDLVVKINIKTPTSLDKRGLAKVLANAIDAATEEVIVEHVYSANGKTDINVFFTGQRGKILKSKFTTFIGDKNNLKLLAPYEAVVSSSSKILPSSLLQYLVLLASFLIFYNSEVYNCMLY